MGPYQEMTFPGVKQNADGSIDFALTDDEAAAADLALKEFEGLAIHPDCVDRIRNGTIAVALSRYAERLVVTNGVEITEGGDRPSSKIQLLLAKAIASVWKSYSLYPLPIFTFHRATFCRMLGRDDEAKQLFALFLKQHLEFRPDQVDRILIEFEGFDIEEALMYAAK
jgi:hypothetical protein